MISVSHEDLIPLRDAPRHLPSRANGKRLHVSAIYRWAKHGVKGVRLETVCIGGTTYTSAKALQRFADQLTARRSLHAEELPTSAAARRRADALVAARLESELGMDPGVLSHPASIDINTDRSVRP